MLLTDNHLTRAMGNPSFYPHAPSSVELIQTHISWVFLAGDKVYKVKRPVLYDFLDFSSLEKRYFYCHEELRLNRRLAPDVYESVLPVTDDGSGALVLNGEGTVVEYVLVMRRLPEERMLYRLLKEGTVDDSTMNALAHHLYTFHQHAETGGDVDRLGSLETIRMNHDENFHETEAFIGTTVSARAHRFLKVSAREFMEQHKDLFERRVGQHRIRDCHGDLHLEHICLDGDTIVIFDCIEFNRRFRSLDVAAEIAFLSMDLEGGGYEAQERAFLKAYLYYSGDNEIKELLNFYRSYFAFVRGKVTGFRLNDPSGDNENHRESIREASHYFERAVNYAARPDKPVLIAMAGLMGTGKSSVAEKLAPCVNGRIIQSDLVRKQLLGIDPSSRHYDIYGQGIYSKEISSRTYKTMLEQAKNSIARGNSVILDASFQKRKQREEARALAGRLKIDFFLVECSCPEEEIQKRLKRRTEQPGHVSDGRWELYENQKNDFDPLNDIHPEEYIRADTSLPITECLFDVLETFKGLK